MTALLIGVGVVTSLGYGTVAQADDTRITDSSVSVALSSSTPSATGVTATITFTTNAPLTENTVIAMALSNSSGSFNLDSVSGSNITSSSITGTGSTSGSGSSKVLIFTNSIYSAAGSKTITITGITNPAAAGMAMLTMTTQGTAGLLSGLTEVATTSIGEGGGDEGDFGDGSITGDNTITATLTDAQGAAIASETVLAYCGMSYSTATTNASGVATIASMADGNCGVWVNSSNYYSDTSYFTFVSDSTAKSQAVALTGIALDATVEITLTDPSNAAVSGAYLFITNTDGQSFSGQTDSSGVVEVGAVYGTYTLDGYLNTDRDLYYIPDTTFTVSSTGIATTNSYELDVQLESFTSFIAGTVTSATTGLALSTPEVLVYADGAMTFSPGDSDGTYSMGVQPGTYTVKGEKTGYANGSISGVAVGADETISGQNIALQDAGNTLNLSAVDSDGNVLSVSGYAFCKDPAADYSPVSFYFKQVTNGAATFHFPDGDFQCDIFATGYVSNNPTFTLSGNETETGNVTLTTYDSTLSVSLVDQDGNSLSSLRFGVFGTSTDGNSLSGYSLGGSSSFGAMAGTYTVRAYVMGGGYTSDYNSPATVTLTAGSTATATITVYETTATISGTLTGSDQATVAGATVKAACVKSGGKAFDFTTQTDTNGNYSLEVVSGTCTLNAASPDSNHLPSGDGVETVNNGDVIDHDLQLLNSNATLVVTPVQAGASVAALSITSGSCYAYNSDGVYVTAEMDTTSGSASLPVRAGEWSYGCRVVSNDLMKVSEADATATVQTNQTKAVTATVASAGDNYTGTVFQFSATSDNTLTLPDGTTIFVPANALANSGNVNITASLATNVASEDGLAAGPAIELTASDNNGRQITGNFSGNLSIQFPYTDDTLASYGLNEDDLDGGYTYKNGALAVTDQGYTVDTDANTVTVTTNHFSAFAIAGAKTPAASAPSKPKSLKAKHILAKTAKLTWQVPSTGTVTKYKIQLRRHGVKKQSKWITYKRVTKLHKLVESLRAETRYQFRVKACNGTLCSGYAKWTAFKTK